MFGFLKDKLSKAVKSIAERLKEKDEKTAEIETEVEKKEEAVVEELSREQSTNGIVPEETIEERIEERVEAAVSEEVRKQVGEVAEPVEPGEFAEPEPHAMKPPKAETTVHVERRTLPKEEKSGYEPSIKAREDVIASTRKEPLPLPVEPEKRSFIKRIFEKVTKTIVERKLGEAELTPVLDQLENDLIESDVALDVSERIKEDLLRSLTGTEIRRGAEKEAIIGAFKDSIRGILLVPEVDLKELAAIKKPVVLLFLGFNGSGKTTSIAKTANWLKTQGYSCVLAAADSWRAAAIEQLEEHGVNIGVKVIKHDYGADPAAIVFDAVEHAKAKGINFVLADSAGRTHTNQNLMSELGKIIRVNKPDLKILVIDSMTGNDAVLQAKEFGAVGVDAVIFTKIDVNEKGGAILSVTNELKKPILFLGIGQEYGDFEKFDTEKFIGRIF